MYGDTGESLPALLNGGSGGSKESASSKESLSDIWCSVGGRILVLGGAREGVEGE